MARIRSIHYDALKSEKLAAASAEAERCYWRLSTHCDDAGRAEDDPRLFAAYLFPLNDDITGPVVDGWLAELARLGLIVRYEVDGRRFLEVAKWADYQKPNRPTPSKNPPPPCVLSDDSVSDHAPLTPGVEWSGVGDGEGDNAARKRATRPTQSFAIDDALRAWGAEKVPGVDLDREREAWLDWCAAKGQSYKDHRAAFQTWCRRSFSFQKPALSVRPQPDPVRAVLGRGVGAAPIYDLDDEGNAVLRSESLA